MSGEPWARLDLAPLPAAVVADGVARRDGVVYASRPGFRPLELDLYAPERLWSGPAPGPGAALPVVVWIHGGAFAMGSRRLLPEFLEAFDFFRAVARAGFVVASVDYRLSGEARWPAPLLDVRSALRWLSGRAEELGIDPGAVAVWGESAGAHLATMAGLRARDAVAGEEPGLATVPVAGVVDWYGPTNFARMDEQAPPDSAMPHDAPDSPESLLLGAPVQDAPELVASADPASYARPGLPPVLIRHGRRDRFVPFGQSVLLAEALQRAGSPVRFLPVDDADHVFEGHPDPAGFVVEAIDFLHEVMPAGPAAARARQEDAS